MTAKLKIYLAQINSIVGDLDGNAQKILREFKRANESGCDLAVFPEMTICGYPCEDLWQKKDFVNKCQEKVLEIIKETKDSKCAILLGAPTNDLERKKEVIRNSALLIEQGEIKKIINKKTLPNFGVFDEARYFEPSQILSLVEFRGLTLAILVCEDLWDSRNIFLLREQIFDAAITLNASPYSSRKHEYREQAAKKLGKNLIYVNQIGGQDSLVFDGSSFAMNSQGEIVLQMKEFTEDSAVIEIEKSGEISPSTKHEARSTITERNYQACILGLRDYVRKNEFKKVLLGMSGGIDSALVAAMAVDALGKENVSLYALPSRYSSDESMNDAKKCAENLDVKLEVVSIEPAFESMLFMLRQAQHDVAELTQENLQSRIRGNILMALSNNSGALLLSTGNKSELATGYATLYGDMCGAFNPLKDLYKTQVYELAELKKDVIPQNILTKAPTAELRPNQKDSDSLPDYEILDKILFALIEEKKSIAEIAKNFDENLVKKVAKLLHISEYKRRQSCLGPKISDMAFDKDRRYPVTNKFNQ
ncbi:MAG: NAD+ synthase [Proteobacteria bacterium]|nr:NAD+ synthase [Pseudomonadota bacterium]